MASLSGGEEPRVAIEEDALLVGLASAVPVPEGAEVVRRVGPRARVLVGPDPSQVTVATGFHAAVDDVVAELARGRGWVARAARDLARPAAIAVHPQAPPCPRGDRAPTSLVRIHLQVDDRQRLMALHNHLREHLPVLVALGAGAPFRAGADAGVASVRQAVHGVPPDLRSWEEVEEDAAWARTAHIALEERRAAWELRLDPEASTVELAAVDLQPTVAAVRSLVGVVAALARAASLGFDAADAAAPLLPAWRIQEGVLAARRDGMDAVLADPRSGDVLSARAVAEQLLEAIEPWADASAYGARALVERNAAATLREVGAADAVDWLCDVYA